MNFQQPSATDLFDALSTLYAKRPRRARKPRVYEGYETTEFSEVAEAKHEESKRPLKRVRKLCSYGGCTSYAQSSGLCIAHGGGKRCKKKGCNKAGHGGGFCRAHGGGRRCRENSCSKHDVGGGFCGAHGGGKRCKEEDCTKGDVGGGFCAAHGGGKRCQMKRCNKFDKGGGFCIVHGGGPRCQEAGCEKGDVGGGFCVAHGGGPRCQKEGCSTGAARGGFCAKHGGGFRCEAETHVGEETPPLAQYVFSTRVACNGVARPDLSGKRACTLCVKHLDPSNVATKQVMDKEHYTLAAMVQELVSRGLQSLLSEVVNDCEAGPSHRRMDLSVPTGAPLLLGIEIDEGQHPSYTTSCEHAKLAGHLIDEGAAHFDKHGNFREGALRRKMHFIRFNPDGYVDATGKKVGALLQYTKLNRHDSSLSLKPTALFAPAIRRLADRVAELIALAHDEEWLEAQPEMQVEYMRYDGDAA